MFYKELPAGGNLSGVGGVEVIDFHESGLNKLASVGTYIPPHLIRVIREIKQSPDPRFAYLYDRALGAGEVYGPNNNGDWFGRDELIRKHQTFVTDSHLFRHHKNRDPRNKIGDVLASAYNDRIDTVDLIIRAPIDNIREDLKRLEAGNVLATSMGVRVKHDQCSICGNKASRRIAYCNHLRSEMLKIYPDGRQVFAINPDPRFVDISIVVIPADPSSAVLRKIASHDSGYAKSANMHKRDEGFIEHDSRLVEGEGRNVIRPELIKATMGFDRPDVVKTLDHAYGPLRPDEFQAIMKKDASIINPDIIPYVQFEGVDPTDIGGEVISDLVPHIQKIANLQVPVQAKPVNFGEMSHHDKIAYLNYRMSCGPFSKMFIR